MSISSLAPPLEGTRQRRLGRHGALFVVAFLLFLLGALVSSIDPARVRAEEAAAERLGVPLRELPGEVLSMIAQQHSSVGRELLLTLPSVAGMVLFAIVMHRTLRGTGSLDFAGTAAAALSAAAWVGCMLLYLGLFAGPDDLPYLHDHFASLTAATVAVSVMSGSVAVLLLVVHLRSLGLARRVGLVVAALAVLALVAAPVPAVGGMPPVFALLLAMVLGTAMIRGARNTPSRL